MVDVLSDSTGTVALAGAGKMGGAMLRGWIARGLPHDRIAVFEPYPDDDLLQLEKQGLRLNPDRIVSPAALVVAVKPQMFEEAAPFLRNMVSSATLVLSIMAGKTRAAIEDALGGAVVRTMPNTPAAIGRGISVAIAAQNVSRAQRSLADALLATTGAVEWIDDEALMDAVTAVSGSGPAYVFLLAEELARAGIAAGLPAPLAARLARETVAGAGELLHRSDLDAATLRLNVTSPGGTTAAALSVLMADDGLRPLLERAVQAAAKRSRELAG